MRLKIVLCSLVMVVGWGQSEVALAREVTVRLELSGRVPFSREELVRAFQARMGVSKDEASGVLVQINGHGNDSLVIIADGMRRVLQLHGHRGMSGARLVAIATADMMIDPATPDPIAPSSAPVNRSASAPVPPAKVKRTDTPTKAFKLPPMRFDLRAAAVGGFAPGEDVGMLLGLGAAMSWGGLLCRLEVGWWHIFGQRVEFGGAPEVTFNALLMRLEGGLRFSHFELRAGPFIAPYQVAQDSQTDGGVLGGLGVGLRARIAATRRWGFFVGTGFDVHFNRVQVVSLGSTALATPRLGWWLGAGTTWDFGP